MDSAQGELRLLLASNLIPIIRLGGCHYTSVRPGRNRGENKAPESSVVDVAKRPRTQEKLGQGTQASSTTDQSVVDVARRPRTQEKLGQGTQASSATDQIERALQGQRLNFSPTAIPRAHGNRTAGSAIRDRAKLSVEKAVPRVIHSVETVTKIDNLLGSTAPIGDSSDRRQRGWGRRPASRCGQD